VVWKSFQLDPSIKTNLSLSLTEHLAASKGWSIEQTRQIQSQVVNMAAEVGLNFDFDRAVVANSFDAHRFIQLAKTQDLGDAAKEELFRAYFSEGKNTARPRNFSSDWN
jgi:predicted DsbA family dithiol-disulfide isomerase